MSPQKQREIASKGGRMAHEKGAAHEWTVDEAREAGRKGGSARHGKPIQTNPARLAEERFDLGKSAEPWPEV
jgi:general stress protein YciG